MPFRYHNARLKFDIEEMLRELRNTCEGKNLSIAAITGDQDGNYSDANLMRFLDDLVLADYPDYYLSTLTGDETERIEQEKDYLKTLLYLMIRSAQARIDYFNCSHGYDTVKEDTFNKLIEGVEGHDSWPTHNLTLFNMPYKRCHLLSPDMDGTIRSVYFYLTGEDKDFPDPYLLKDETAVKDRPSAAPADHKSVTSESAETDEYLIDLRFTMSQAETDDYYHGDISSEEDWAEVYGGNDHGLDDLEDRIRRSHLGNTSTEDGMARLEKQKRYLQIFFQNKDEFIKMYDHLIEINKPGVETYADKIPGKIEGWLKKNGRMVYSDDAASENVFEMLLAAAKEVELWQERKL